MRKLNEIVKDLAAKQAELKQLSHEFKAKSDRIKFEIEELSRLENIGGNGIDLEKIQLAESIMYIYGNPYGKADSKFNCPTIAEEAIIDIANDCPHLISQFFGNKRYESFYQRTNCEYGYGPRHGSIVDEIGLKSSVRSRECVEKSLLTDDEKDACIYYIKNFASLPIKIQQK